METVLIIALGFALGGILKGATGAGAPVVAVPLLVLFFDVPTAIAIFAIPNLLPNLWQSWTFRKHLLPMPFVAGFALSGAAGAFVGTEILTRVPADNLSLVVAAMVWLYIAFRLMRPDWALAYPRALRMAVPVGALAGVLQTAAGLSAPASITFLNAMRLDRLQFIPTIAAFFAAIGLVQIPLLLLHGILTPERIALGFAALVPLMLFMPVGAFLVRHVSKEVFEKVILLLLAGLAAKIIYAAL